MAWLATFIPKVFALPTLQLLSSLSPDCSSLEVAEWWHASVNLFHPLKCNTNLDNLFTLSIFLFERVELMLLQQIPPKQLCCNKVGYLSACKHCSRFKLFLFLQTRELSLTELTYFILCEHKRQTNGKMTSIHVRKTFYCIKIHTILANSLIISIKLQLCQCLGRYIVICTVNIWGKKLLIELEMWYSTVDWRHYYITFMTWFLRHWYVVTYRVVWNIVVTADWLWPNQSKPDQCQSHSRTLIWTNVKMFLLY